MLPPFLLQKVMHSSLQNMPDVRTCFMFPFWNPHFPGEGLKDGFCSVANIKRACNPSLTCPFHFPQMWKNKKNPQQPKTKKQNNRNKHPLLSHMKLSNTTESFPWLQDAFIKEVLSTTVHHTKDSLNTNLILSCWDELVLAFTFSFLYFTKFILLQTWEIIPFVIVTCKRRLRPTGNWNASL